MEFTFFPSQGGGIFNTGTLRLTRSTVSGNHVYAFGGGMVNSGVATVVDSTISGNQTEVEGGIGIFNNGGTLTVTNSTVSDNGPSQEGATGAASSTLAARPRSPTPRDQRKPRQWR